MTTATTTLLGLALPVTGELSGTWGDTVNNSITSLLDSAIAGTTTITTDADITLTTTTLSANEARQAIIRWATASGTTTRYITAPAQSKVYAVINDAVAAQSIVLRGVGPTTGVTIVQGEKCVCAWNGTDFVKLATSTVDGVSTISFASTGLTPSTATSGAVTVAGTLITTNGGTGLSSFTAGDLIYFSTGTSFTKLGIGTNGQILTSSGSAPQWSAISSVGVGSITFGSTGLTPNTATSGNVTVAGTLNVSNGGTGVTSSSGANSVVLRDSNQNVAANSFLSNFTTVVSAGTTTTLTVASAPFYLITGSTSHTFQLPNATTLVNGTTYAFNNNSSSGSVSVNNGAVSPTLIATVGSGSYTVVTLLDNSTQAGSWDKHVQAPSNVTWTTNTFNYVGSITGATWNGNAVGVLYGGTGATTVAGAQTNLQVDPAGTAIAMAIALG